MLCKGKGLSGGYKPRPYKPRFVFMLRNNKPYSHKQNDKKVAASATTFHKFKSLVLIFSNNELALIITAAAAYLMRYCILTALFASDKRRSVELPNI